MEGALDSLVPHEGWHVLHLFYRVEHAAWQELPEENQFAARTQLASLVQEIHSTENVQLLAMSMVSPKADLGFMLVGPDLQIINALEKRLTLSLGPEILTPVYSYYSLTESSEYTTTEEEYSAEIADEKPAGTPEHDAAMQEFRDRISKYKKHKLYPGLPDWPVLCFYPMSKKREHGQNWYLLPLEERRQLMKGHAAMGRRWAGKIIQLITGSTGLDDHEWGVTLFAKNVSDVKGIIYEMRFDPVSAKYADFGDFFIGLQMPVRQLFSRLQL